ncbi:MULTISPECIES: hypothetical protein [Actinoplanes]|nr:MULTISPECIES: hypothetical protein [Actinoplanes]GLY05125.1 hypothetical protein Acsp01_55040 [Actinoplanes sp. NBRC 101535]
MRIALVWTAAPLMLLYGGWIGVLGGALIALYGAHLLAVRRSSFAFSS